MLDQKPVAWAVMLSPVIPRCIGITTVDLQTRWRGQGYPKSSFGRSVNASSPAPPMVSSM